MSMMTYIKIFWLDQECISSCSYVLPITRQGLGDFIAAMVSSFALSNYGKVLVITSVVVNGYILYVQPFI